MASSLLSTVSKAREWLPKNRSTLRPDIQGLRALAVLAVIADHLLGWPSGGFIGVDVFFVISGFLITGLLREHERTNKISFLGFYARRIKRLVPAATIVLISTVVAASLIFNPVRAMQTLWDAVSSFFFFANWNFAASGTDYFEAAGPVSPLQHFWSLAVEEQFYFAWPWVMLAVLAIAARLGGRSSRRLALGGVMGIVVVASLAWAIFETATNPTLAYFSTFTRAWELGIGALVAIAVPLCAKIPNAARPVLGWLGLAGLVASLFIIDDSLPFPAPWALFPVIATALVIVAGTGGEQRYLLPLTNNATFYIGNISYSLYLWHFPAIILIGALVEESVGYYAMTIAAMTVLAIASYHLVEKPFQKMPVLNPGKGDSRASRDRNHKARAWRTWREQFGTTYKVGGFALLTVVSFSLVAGALSPTPAPLVAPVVAASEDMVADGEPAPAFGPAVAAVQAELTAALGQTSWPGLEPTVDFVLANDLIPAGVSKCAIGTPQPVAECTFGNDAAPKTAVLAGDSVAAAWIPALLPSFASGDWKMIIQPMYGCPLVDIATEMGSDEKEANCESRKQAAIEVIADVTPDVVLVGNTSILPAYASSGSGVTLDGWNEGLRAQLTQIDVPTVILSPPPADVDIADCYTPSSTPIDCISQKTSQWTKVSEIESALSSELGDFYVDTSALYCVGESGCPSNAAGLPIKRDQTHVTQPYAEYISDGLGELIRAAGFAF
jgi:peptidoglycan/LPS O-acetylase OafA/YrhL